MQNLTPKKGSCDDLDIPSSSDSVGTESMIEQSRSIDINRLVYPNERILTKTMVHSSSNLLSFMNGSSKSVLIQTKEKELRSCRRNSINTLNLMNKANLGTRTAVKPKEKDKSPKSENLSLDSDDTPMNVGLKSVQVNSNELNRL